MAGRGDFGSEDVGCDMDFLGSYCLFFCGIPKNTDDGLWARRKRVAATWIVQAGLSEGVLTFLLRESRFDCEFFFAMCEETWPFLSFFERDARKARGTHSEERNHEGAWLVFL